MEGLIVQYIKKKIIIIKKKKNPRKSCVRFHPGMGEKVGFEGTKGEKLN